ncbi:MAG: RNA 2',3'-cyclic phosphodiesterase [Sulfuritalea sp.]|nr:RNA 2',3'-cyclic phosphodiesterase [Sulfuritalea sp.]
MAESAPRRVFFALWPPAETLSALDAVATETVRRCGGRRTRRDALHLTLAFIGVVTSARLDALRNVAGRVRAEPFSFVLDRLGCWPRNRIVWTGCGAAPSAQNRLCATLAARLAEAGFIIDRRPFVPHVTLVRDARCDRLPERTSPIPWRVGDFVLAESLLQPAGARYRLLGRWPLVAAPYKNLHECS